MFALLPFLFLSALASSSFASLFERFADLPRPTEYDFIIVGAGGVAGCVLANRLSEDRSFNVLLLEAGGTNIGKIDLEVPLFTSLISSEFNWNLTTTPQTSLNGRSFPFPRGFVLGGSSSINGMVYNRGSKGDWDRYAEVTGDSGWSWDNIQRYIVKNERFTPPADRHNTSGQFDPSIHSFNGTNAVSLSGFNGYVLESAVLSASQQLGGPFSFVLDYNSGSALGFGWYQSTINGANRSSAAVSYLHPALTRPNLHVLLNARVSRVLPTGSGENSRDLNIKTVEFAQDIEDGPFIQLTATKEVILSSGSVGTPHILLNSGIGNSTTLSSLGKSVVFDLPSVGQNVSVHPLTHPVFVVNSSITTEDPIFQNSSFRAELLQQWSETGTGPLVKTRGTFNAQMRLDDDFIQKLGIDPSSSPTSPHFTLVTQNSFYPLSPPNGSYLSFLILVDSPTSRGSITLSSSNPFSPPVIDVACLETLFDLLAMRAAVKAVLEYTSTPAWEGYILGPFTDLANATSSDDPEELDKRLDDYIRATTEPTGHIVGTASMSRKGAPFGVVDPDLAVKGIKGLRVVDASVLPYVPSGHTQVPVYIVAERAADLIKAQWA